MIPVSAPIRLDELRVFDPVSGELLRYGAEARGSASDDGAEQGGQVADGHQKAGATRVADGGYELLPSLDAGLRLDDRGADDGSGTANGSGNGAGNGNGNGVGYGNAGGRANGNGNGAGRANGNGNGAALAHPELTGGPVGPDEAVGNEVAARTASEAGTAGAADATASGAQAPAAGEFTYWEELPTSGAGEGAAARRAAAAIGAMAPVGPGAWSAGSRDANGNGDAAVFFNGNVASEADGARAPEGRDAAGGSKIASTGALGAVCRLLERAQAGAADSGSGWLKRKARPGSGDLD
jgi:hypothetical protein